MRGKKKIIMKNKKEKKRKIESINFERQGYKTKKK